MIPIRLTERTISTRWDKEAQEHVSQITDTPVHVNPEQIVWFRGNSDAPEKYATYVRIAGGWDLFVVEDIEDIEMKLRDARDITRWSLADAIKDGITGSR